MPVNDATPLFKAMAKMRRAKMAALGEEPPGERPLSPETMPSPAFSFHSVDLAQICSEFTDLFNLVLSQKSEYLMFNSASSMMSDRQRDQFDEQSEKALKQLVVLASSLKARVEDDPALRSTSVRDHLVIAAREIERRVHDLAQIIAQMRAYRLSFSAKKQRLLRLSNLVDMAKEKQSRRERLGLPNVNSFSSLIERREDKENSEDGGLRRRRRESKSPSSVEDEEREGGDAKGESDEEEEDVGFEGRTLYEDVQKQPRTWHDEPADDGDMGLSPEMKIQLTEENERVYERLALINRDMDLIEAQVTEIQRLGEVLSEKVMDQEQDIELLNQQAVNTTENIREGNEWIREAITNSASRRVVILFCIIVLTFTILFVDWYHP